MSEDKYDGPVLYPFGKPKNPVAQAREIIGYDEKTKSARLAILHTRDELIDGIPRWKDPHWQAEQRALGARVREEHKMNLIIGKTESTVKIVGVVVSVLLVANLLGEIWIIKLLQKMLGD